MIIGGGRRVEAPLGEIDKTLPQFARDVEQPVVGSALVGFRTPAEASENLGALGWEISATDIAEVDTARHGAVTAPCWRSEEEEIVRLQGKVGIVTAAASGMGRAGVLRFAREGASVAVVDLDAAGVEVVVGQITEAGGKAIGIPGDLTDDAFSHDIVRQTANAFGGLDFVWNHVGHPGPAAVEGIDMADFDIAINLNLRTVLVTTEAAIPEMRARGGGALLYTASTSGLVGSGFSPIYSMAKFGVVGFVRALAKRLAPDNIRVNAVCPGPIDTPMLRVFVARPDEQRAPGDQDKEALIIRRSQAIPMKRTGKPEEVANAALFLLSDEASFVSGAALPVDGGATA